VKLDLSSAEAQLNTLIERRASERSKANEIEDMWRASERKHREKIRRENRARWFAFYSRLAESLRARAEEYEHRAESLCEEPYQRPAK
jgi:hypothetical protein